MTQVELTKMSSKGQIVIPLKFRKEMQWNEGDPIAVTGSGDSLFLKRVRTPSKEEILMEWEKLNKEGRKQAKKLGIKETDVPRLIHKGRGVKK